jgi:zinc protease
VLTPDKANAMYFAGFSFPLQDTDPQYPALVMGNYVLGSGTLSSRLGDRVRQKEGLSYGVRSSLSVSELDPRAAWIIYAIMNPTNAGRTAEVILEEVKLLADKGMTEDELGRAKQGYLEQRRVTRSNDNTLASLLADNLYVGRTMAFEAEFEKKVRALSTKQVDEATKRFLTPGRLVITIAGDLKKK